MVCFTMFTMRKLGIIPQLIIILALVICQQLIVSHSISHIHQQLEEFNHGGGSSDEIGCDTCHALGGLNHFFVGNNENISPRLNVSDVQYVFLAIHFDPIAQVIFESRAPPVTS